MMKIPQSRTPVRSSDLRRLRDALASQFTALADQPDALKRLTLPGLISSGRLLYCVETKDCVCFCDDEDSRAEIRLAQSPER
jgi:hypothetical protein